MTRGPRPIVAAPDPADARPAARRPRPAGGGRRASSTSPTGRVDSPLGALLLAATPDGVVRVAFASEGHDDVLAALATAISPRILAAPARLDPVARQLDEYFAGRRRTFDVAVDLQLASGFRRSVLQHLREIPYGATESYAAVARAAGSPNAVRAAGSACATNPVPVVVPCHRVVRSDGSIGQYRGGVAAKRTLLALEAA